MKNFRPIPFPENFWWGTSLSAHQAEGGNINSWTRWEDQPKNIKNNEKSAGAAQHWHLFEKDFDNLVWLNANTHRFSIEWSRLEPVEGQWNHEAAAHYRKMILSLKRRHIRPVLCLFHFTLPLWVEDQGGFENPKMITAFTEFAKRTQGAFGDLIEDWLTMNEPVIYALGAYGAGLTPPGVKNLKRALSTIVHLMKAHGEVYHAIKGGDKNAQVSFAHHLRIFTPRFGFSPIDHWMAKLCDEVFNWSYYQVVKSGRIKLRVPTIFDFEAACPEGYGAMDFIGFNYYSRDLVSLNPFSYQKVQLSTPTSAPKTDMGWEIYPEGLTSLLKKIKALGMGNLPILITENGLANSDDRLRKEFIFSHLYHFLSTCEKEGLKAKGYLHWSLIDNFEWIDGYYPRFGLFEVNYETQERIPRESAYYFRELGQTRSLVRPQRS